MFWGSRVLGFVGLGEEIRKRLLQKGLGFRVCAYSAFVKPYRGRGLGGRV